MNNNLPYISLPDELNLNAGVLIILIADLAKTKRNKFVLNFDKLQIFYYLVNKPFHLRRFLQIAAKPEVELREDEYFSVNAISFNVDDLFDRDRLKYLLKYISTKGYIQSIYDKSNGFCFVLSENGLKAAKSLNEDYFNDVKKYTRSLHNLLSVSNSKLNGFLNQIFVEAS